MLRYVPEYVLRIDNDYNICLKWVERSVLRSANNYVSNLVVLGLKRRETHIPGAQKGVEKDRFFLSSFYFLREKNTKLKMKIVKCYTYSEKIIEQNLGYALRTLSF